MRYNKQELFALASKTSQNFDREGVMVLKERQDGFFRRSEGQWADNYLSYCALSLYINLYEKQFNGHDYVYAIAVHN